MKALNQSTLRLFDCKPRVWEIFDFFGTGMENLRSRSFHISQFHYVQILQLLPLDASFEIFWSYRAMLAWIGYTRPGASCGINKTVQVTEKSFSAAKLKSFNETDKIDKQTSHRYLSYNILTKIICICGFILMPLLPERRSFITTRLDYSTLRYLEQGYYYWLFQSKIRAGFPINTWRWDLRLRWLLRKGLHTNPWLSNHI